LNNALNKPVYKVFILFLIGCCIAVSSVYGQSSVLQSGKWYKVAIEKNGVYKIDRALFKKMGFDPSQVNPQKIKIYGNEGGMLPQANSAARPVDLIENAIHVEGEGDGVFNTDDYILFYAQGPHKISFIESKEIFQYEKNLYADQNYYFITVGELNGKRITTSDNIPGSFPVVNQFENFVYHELEQYNHLKSGREWFGERFNPATELILKFDLSNVVENSVVTLVSDVVTINMGNSFQPISIGSTSFNLLVNGNPAGQQTIVPIPYLEYGLKGRHNRDTLTLNATTVLAPGKTSQEIKYQYNKSATGTSYGYLDFCLLQVTQELALYGHQTSFRSLISLDNPVSKYEIEETSAETRVWDISTPNEPLLQLSSFSSGKTSFASVSSVLKEFIAFSSAPSPELIGAVPNQNIRDIAVPDFLIVTHPDFKTEAVRLATHRNAVNGLSATVVTTTEVYNEFSSGRQDVTAIRDFVKSLNEKSPGTLKALLLFGKGSYNYGNISLVPTYESRSSLHPLTTYSSDDYFSFLDDNEGEWSEEPAANHTMDISVGRIPIKNLTEAKNVVDKIIRYDTDATLLGKWRKDIVFIADDGDFNLHQDDANDLAGFVETNHGEFNTKKIFLDSYPQQSRPSGEVSPETNKIIEESFYKGALVINYTGHGGERLWAQEKIFDDLMIAQLENERLPLLVTATCEFGRQDDPAFISGAELCMLRKQGGAISLVTTSRPVNAATNFLLNEAFYDAFFQKENNQYLSLGEIFRRTKNNSLSGVSNRNFSLIGDPSLRLAMPQHEIKITEISTASGSPTLKALSTVTVKGIVADNTGDTLSGFNGILEATLFDKETSFVTLGNENQPYPFKQWYNALFRGKASIQQGVFEFQFVVPKNINYQIDEGKFSLYAYDDFHKTEASGFSQDLQIGSSEPDPEIDSTSPLLNLFMGDTTFVNGGVANPNTTLVARLLDANGINISGYGIGNSIIGMLDEDETETFVLNDYYEADVDDFTKGTISFPLFNISPGKHTITVKAWDTHNNPVQSTIEFMVTEGSGIVIGTFGNYPNPFKTSTTFFFTHNRSGDDLQASLALYDYTGRIIESFDVDVPASGYQVELPILNWNTNTTKNHPGGLYFARLLVRSLTDGSKNEQVTKLILSN
jgi:hypothetical protein